MLQSSNLFISQKYTSKPMMNDDGGNIDSMDELPPNMEVYRQKFGKAALVCPNCDNMATGGHEPHGKGYTEMECVIFSCRKDGCSNKGWAWCSTCKERFHRSNVGSHAGTLKHKNNLSKIEVATAIVLNKTDEAVIRETRSQAMMSSPQQEDFNLTNTASVGTYAFPDDG
jgi:hypothetical protein